MMLRTRVRQGRDDTDTRVWSTLTAHALQWELREKEKLFLTKPINKAKDQNEKNKIISLIQLRKKKRFLSFLGSFSGQAFINPGLGTVTFLLSQLCERVIRESQVWIPWCVAQAVLIPWVLLKVFAAPQGWVQCRGKNLLSVCICVCVCACASVMTNKSDS